MAHLKFAADQIFDGYKMLSNKVLITDNEGVIVDLIEDDGADDVQRFSGILSPGFINAHCHLELSHMKSLIPEKTGLVDFVFSVVTQRHFKEEEILEAIDRAETEMLQNGIVAVGDICNNTLTIPQKQKNRLAYYNFIEVSGWVPSVAEKRFQHSLEIYKAYSSMDHRPWTMDHTSLVPHAPYSVSRQLWKLLEPTFKGKVVTMHNQETAHEDELFLKGTGDFRRLYQQMNIDDSCFIHPENRSLENSIPHLKSAQNILLVHNTFTNAQDIQFSNFQIDTFSNLFWCLCPNANLYIEDRLPDVQQFIDNNCKIVLGTDSLASNWSLNILDEMKTVQKNFPSIEIETMLKWATINGAEALQMNDVLGSFEKGKKPGLNLIEADMHVRKIM
jgi:cytosine/adenosine deaminase-related metal-dependent hydrolase